MPLDSNARRDSHGSTLPQYSPYPLPLSSGVNILTQTLSENENYYCFPSFCMLESVITFILNECLPLLKVALVLLKNAVGNFWWLLLTQRYHYQLDIGHTGQLGIIEAPTQSGFAPYKLKQSLQVIRLCPKQ